VPAEIMQKRAVLRRKQEFRSAERHVLAGHFPPFPVWD